MQEYGCVQPNQKVRIMADPSPYSDLIHLLREATPLVAVTVSLVAVIVAPFVSWKIAKRQIRASNVSSKRQVWIDELRREVAVSLTLAAHIQELHRPDPDLNRKEFLATMDDKAAAQFRLNETQMLIKLRLNPNETSHNELLAAFEELRQATPDPQPGETEEDQQRLVAEFKTVRAKVLTVTQKILKNEWERVRVGE